MSKKKLTKRERLFCEYFCESGNLYEAATLSGYKNPKAISMSLSSDPVICDEIDRIIKGKTRLLSALVLVGLKRLAFSSISDAVSLLYKDAPTKEVIESLDLFSVSEIKKTDKSVEIKFFDRIKALEKLSQIDTKEGMSASSLIDALSISAEKSFDDNGDISGV